LGIDAHDSDPSVSKALEPYLNALIETLIQNKEPMIIEGVHFLPSFSAKLMEEYPKDIKIVYLGYKDWTPQEKMEDLIRYKDATKNCWYSHYNTEELFKLSEYLIIESNKLYEEVKALHLDYIEVNNVIVQTHTIMKHILKK
ncbi:MAG: hypothetical protein RBT45_02115, partial [Acholeplasmataceae bacterium]|nr:hypothetical protein [Acholeplasmataceae bacterium]